MALEGCGGLFSVPDHAHSEYAQVISNGKEEMYCQSYITLMAVHQLGMPQILVVDDEVLVAASIERSLRREYQVRVANSGAEALKMARRAKPDLVILDIIMPGMGGLEVCRELRRDPALKPVPILFLTAKGKVEDRITGLEAGADDYLTKPFDVRELLLRVEAILRRSSSQECQETNFDQLTVGQLTLNRRNYQLRVNDKEVLLTPVEFDLMYHLMSHRDEVFSSERLLRELWDFPSDTGSPDLVRAHIRNLRRKVEVDSRSPQYIVNVPRHGYTIATN
jgi:DNA-binding response OmpR family regulator